MNIFFLDKNLKLCAIYHCNKHVVKMILEYTQLLYTACWVLHQNDDQPKAWLDQAPMTQSGKHGYRMTHKNHPSAIWTRECLENYQWLCQLGLTVCEEYTYRYGKVHSCQVHLEWLKNNPPPLVSNGGETTEFRCAMPDQYKIPGDPIESYRRYYRGDKRSIAQWGPKRTVPDWFRIKLSTPIIFKKKQDKNIKLTFKKRNKETLNNK